MKNNIKNKFLKSIIIENDRAKNLPDLLILAQKMIDKNKRSYCPKEKDMKKNIKKSKILLFRRIMSSLEKENNQWTATGTQYLFSSLKNRGAKIIFTNSSISPKTDEFITNQKGLEKIFKENPDINFVVITLSEAYFDKAKKLIDFIRKRSKAFIGVGGVMPTLTPEQVFVHLPKINFLIRGAGEEIFPKIVKILDGCNIKSHLTKQQLNNLSSLKGFLFYNKKWLIMASLNKINEINNYNNSILDFSFLKKEDVLGGLNLFTSWGCHNNCLFCTSWVRGSYAPKSFSNLKKILYAYYQRLKELYKNEKIPVSAFKLAFNDDDFLGDDKRALKFFNFLRETPFYINFFQTGINSFFIRKKGKYTNSLNKRLLKSLTADLFYPRYLKNLNDIHTNHTYVYIGTENYSNEELDRLGKGYTFDKIRLVVKTLSSKRIYQAHHFIASNYLTNLDDIMENLIKISQLRIIYGDYFSILTPIISYLVSFYPSSSYKIAILNNRRKFLNIRKILSIKNYPEYDYPLVENDIPVNKIVRKFIPLISNLFLTEKDYHKILDRSWFNLLSFNKKTPEGKEINLVINKYKTYLWKNSRKSLTK